MKNGNMSSLSEYRALGKREYLVIITEKKKFGYLLFGLIVSGMAVLKLIVIFVVKFFLAANLWIM